MPRRKAKDAHKRKLITLGNGSLVVTLPIEVARELNWKKGTLLHVKKWGGGVIIKRS